MTTFKNLLLVMLTGLLLGGSAYASGNAPMGDGMPLPWPFPWAKECPVDWEWMGGRYLLTPNDRNEQVDLKITVVNQLDFKLVRVSRYGIDGQLIADGYAWVSKNQKTVRLWLFPLRAGDPPTWAVLKMYYRNNYRECAKEALVPILSLEQVDNNTHTQLQYRLVRVNGTKN